MSMTWGIRNDRRTGTDRRAESRPDADRRDAFKLDLERGESATHPWTRAKREAIRAIRAKALERAA